MLYFKEANILELCDVFIDGLTGYAQLLSERLLRYEATVFFSEEFDGVDDSSLTIRQAIQDFFWNLLFGG